jgi:hypothetical protein
VRGSDPLVDAAIDLTPAINIFLRQRADEITPYDETAAALRVIDPNAAPAEPETFEEAVYDADATTVEAAGEAA